MRSRLRNTSAGKLRTILILMKKYQYTRCYFVPSDFSLHLHAFPRRPWVTSRALGCGVRRGPACTPRRKFGSRAGSVARALGVQSREIWQVITGSLSAELEPSKATENPHVRRFAPHCCNSSPLCGSHGTAAVAHQVCVDHCYACVDSIRVSVLCAL